MVENHLWWLSITFTLRGGRSIAAIDVHSEIAKTGGIVKEQTIRTGLFNHDVVPTIQIISTAFRARILAPRAQTARSRFMRRWWRRRWLHRYRDRTRKFVRVARIDRKSWILPGFVMIYRDILPSLWTAVQFLDVKIIPQSLYFWNFIWYAKFF